MKWKIIALAVLLLSVVAVTIAVTRPNSEILTQFRTDIPKIYLDEPVPLRPIDDGPGG